MPSGQVCCVGMMLISYLAHYHYLDVTFHYLFLVACCYFLHKNIR